MEIPQDFETFSTYESTIFILILPSLKGMSATFFLVCF